MANVSSMDNAGASEPINYELPDPNPHGQVSVHSSHPNHDVLVGQMQRHLDEMSGHLKATDDYHHRGHMPQSGAAGVTGQSSQGSSSSGGASGGADYQTSSADSVGDCDSMGANSD